MPNRNKKTRRRDTDASPLSPSPPAVPNTPPTIPASPSSEAMIFSRKPVPLLVASLGNPRPYLATLHSTGHIMLDLIASRQGYKPFQHFAGGELANADDRPPFSFINGFAPRDGPHQDSLPALWKSGSMMNVSGPAVKRAWEKWKGVRGKEEADRARLIIVHDELEKPVGEVVIKTDHKASAKGHNGVKSLQAALPRENFIRIGVGIGRPASRDPASVSDYVLRKVNQGEMANFEVSAMRVWQLIEEVREGAIK